MIINKCQVFTGDIKECTVYDPILSEKRGIVHTESGRDINPLTRAKDHEIYEDYYTEAKTLAKEIPLIKIQRYQTDCFSTISESAYVCLSDYDLFIDFYLNHIQAEQLLTPNSRQQFPYKRVIFSRPFGLGDLFVDKKSLFNCFNEDENISIRELKRKMKHYICL